MKNFNEYCKGKNCTEYIEWDFGYGKMYSCKLQGQSENITRIAIDCIHKPCIICGNEFQMDIIGQEICSDCQIEIDTKEEPTCHNDSEKYVYQGEGQKEGCIQNCNECENYY